MRSRHHLETCCERSSSAARKLVRMDSSSFESASVRSMGFPLAVYLSIVQNRTTIWKQELLVLEMFAGARARVNNENK